MRTAFALLGLIACGLGSQAQAADPLLISGLAQGNLQAVRQGAQKEARALLDDSTCSEIDYRVLPLSRFGTTVSYFEEVYLSGRNCGASGASYRMGVRAVNLNDQKLVTLDRLFSRTAVGNALRQDSYLKGALARSATRFGPDPVRDLDTKFSDHNRQHCDQTVDSDLLSQFYLFKQTGGTWAVRLGLQFGCPLPGDDTRFPLQLGLNLPAPTGQKVYYTSEQARKTFGEGVQIHLSRPASQ